MTTTEVLTEDQINAAVDQLLRSRTAKQVAVKLDARDNLLLHAEENAKVHPLSEIEFTDEQWGRFVAHMLDGGGARQDELRLGDGPSLRDQFHTALRAGDRKTTMHLLPHLVKSMMKRTAMRTQLRSGGVASAPVGSAKVPDQDRVQRGWPGAQVLEGGQIAQEEKG